MRRYSVCMRHVGLIMRSCFMSSITCMRRCLKTSPIYNRPSTSSLASLNLLSSPLQPLICLVITRIILPPLVPLLYPHHCHSTYSASINTTVPITSITLLPPLPQLRLSSTPLHPLICLHIRAITIRKKTTRCFHR